MSDPSYRVDLESIRRAFPLHLDAPPSLIDFAHWLDGRPWGSVGCFDLVGNFSDHAFWDGSSVRNNFALFMRLPTGSLAGAWYPSGHKLVDAPIVLLDSEGQWKILGPSFEAFLARLSLRDIVEESDLAPCDDEQDATGELAVWLRKRLGGTELAALTKMPAGLPDFRGFMEKWYRDRENYWANHPTMKALAELLVAHCPKGENPWERTLFDAAIVGRQYELRFFGRDCQPIREAAAVEPVLRGLRDDMWRAHPLLGLWYAMSFGMSADGQINPNFDYEARPTIDNKPADLSEAKADLLRAPRPARWVPSWLATS